MSITITVERDEEQILAIYVQFTDKDVAKTVEIADGACYADEDSEGHLVGVELLVPAAVASNLKGIPERYVDQPEIKRMLELALETVHV